jgi:hypothetical protein
MTLELLIEGEPFAIEREILDGPQFAGLTIAERKALAITIGSASSSSPRARSPRPAS